MSDSPAPASPAPTGMTTEQQQHAGGKTSKSEAAPPNQQQEPKLQRGSLLRTYGITVRKMELRDPARRTTFDVIVHTGMGRWNAEMVAQFIRTALRRRRSRCAQCGYSADQVIHDTTWSGAHPFVTATGASE